MNALNVQHAPEAVLIAGRFQLRGCIGSGAVSDVFLASDIKQSGKLYAVKILKPQERSDSDTVDRFWREVQLTQQLEHPNIVRIVSSGYTPDGLPYIVSEYVEGGSLEEHLERRTGEPLPFLRAFNLVRYIARGLAQAHRRGIVHRDLKPANIVLSPSGSVRIIDFGIGRSNMLFSKGTSALVIGTPYYMSPEQIEGTAVTPRSDVYSLALVAFELCTGRRLFEESSWPRLVYLHCHEKMPRFAAEGSDVPCWFETIILKAAEKNPAARYADAGEMLDALEDAMHQSLKEKGLLHRAFHLVRRDGAVCSYLSDRGYTRAQLGAAFAAASVIAGCVLCLA